MAVYLKLWHVHGQNHIAEQGVNFAHSMLEQELVPDPSGSACGVCDCSSSGQALHAPAPGTLGKSCTR